MVGRERVGPLAGVKVIDMTTSYAGPTAAMYLADLGADVIKVERPGTGDDTRGWGPPFVDGVSAWFASANRKKRSVAVDLRAPHGMAVLHRLLADADVFLENMKPSKLAALGIDHATLSARYPRLVYCALSGFGLDGPDAALAGYDLVAQARSGLMSVTGAAGGPPQRVSTALSDVVTGICAALGVSAALVRQREHGIGDLVDVSLLDTDLAIMAPRIAAYLAGEPEPAPSGGTDSVLAVYQVFPTKDRDIVIAIGNDSLWRRFCVLIGRGDLSADDRLADNAGRRANRAWLTEVIGQCLVTRTAAEWIEQLDAAGIPCSAVRSLSEVVRDPQVRARGSLIPLTSPGGPLTGLHAPFRLGSMAEGGQPAVPALAEHTVEVLLEHGYSMQEIGELVDSGSVGCPSPAEG
jgi:crotonobetainyl-CoA:carnitine CoA-transferase CaiB-like acyl-CoA transferase